MNIAIIPARGGSKRIPRKNIKFFLGKPIIAYSIETALQSGLFDEVMVSTEDDEIAKIAMQYGAIVPFKRSIKNADDFTGPGDVTFEVLTNYENLGKHFENICCIFATAPLISVTRLQECFDLLETGAYTTTFPVSEYASPIFRSFKMSAQQELIRNFPEYEKSRSQDLPKTYYDAGQFYWCKSSQFKQLENKNVFGLTKGAVILNPMETQDIDTIEDWEVAEFKYEYNTRKAKR